MQKGMLPEAERGTQRRKQARGKEWKGKSRHPGQAAKRSSTGGKGGGGGAGRTRRLTAVCIHLLAGVVNLEGGVAADLDAGREGQERRGSSGGCGGGLLQSARGRLVRQQPRVGAARRASKPDGTAAQPA